METLFISGYDIAPTRAHPCEKERLQRLSWFFENDKTDLLCPVWLVKLNEEALLVDGNHRLLLTLLYGKKLQAEVYVPNEIIQRSRDHSAPSWSMDDYYVKNALKFRKLAIKRGYHTFNDLFSLAYPNKAPSLIID